MKLAATVLFLAGGASAFSAPSRPAASTALGAGETVDDLKVLGAGETVDDPKVLGAGETVEDLKVLAKQLNPVVGYFDPLNIGTGGLDNNNIAKNADVPDEYLIGWFRHAEIKHGRVAMAAFLGYIVQSNTHWSFAMNKAGDAWPSVELSPQAQWDALPIEAKGQIIFFVGCLEIWDEMGGGNFNGVKPVLPHYTKGRKPGQYPSLKEFRNNIHFVLDLYDPFGAWKGRSDEAKAKGRLAEINNGRLAMLGIMGFVSEGSIQGSVPALKTLVQHYDGNIWDPFEVHGF